MFSPIPSTLAASFTLSPGTIARSTRSWLVEVGEIESIWKLPPPGR